MAKSRTLNQIRQSKEYQRALDIQTEKVENEILNRKTFNLKVRLTESNPLAWMITWAVL